MMKKIVMGALLAGQLQMAAQPALAADLQPVGDHRTGAFGGLRVRVPFGGQASDRRLRAGLTLAPLRQERFATGETRLRMGEGFEFGLRGREPLHFSIGGRDLRRPSLQDGRSNAGGRISTGAWIAGGLVLVTVGLVVTAALVLESADDDD